jgi:trigger factor
LFPVSTSELTDPQAQEQQQPLKIDISVQSPQACLREVVVTVADEEVRRYLKKAYDELVPEAQVPGFRAGRAPRKLVEKQFKDRVHEQVKGSLVMDSLAQVTESQPFSAISEPNFDFDAIELPDSGPFVFQFSVEVRPEFPTPQWQGLPIVKPVEAITEEDIDSAIERVLSRNATIEATDEAAVLGDRLLITAVFKDQESGKVLSELEEERVTLRNRLSFSDGVCESFGELLVGAVEGDIRQGTVKVSETCDDESRRGSVLNVEFKVIEVMRRTIPDLSPSVLQELGDFESVDEFRTFVRSSLERQAEYRQQQAVRSAVVGLLAGTASFELPADLVRRQTSRELQRKVLELRRSGFGEDEVRRIVNLSRQNAQASTELALREHFILEQIAEELKIEADDADYDAEVKLIAQQSDEPERRVRARLEKSGQMDALRNQIIERKVIEAIVAQATITEQAVERDNSVDEEFAVFHSMLGTKDTASIPQAMHDETPQDGTKNESTPR